MPAATAATPAAQNSPNSALAARTSLYRWYVLALLWLVALLRFVDLQIMAVLLEPVKAEFLLSDTQLALLGGLAFALFYGVLGVPAAWLADRCSRRNIIAAAVALWSLMTALCGFAGSFAMLFLARMGVGIGEAGAYPPTTALLADYFPPHQRGRVYAVLASAIPAGVFAGFLIGGVVSQLYGWRLAMQVVGLPGLLVGVLVFLTVREPVRGTFDEFIEPAGTRHFITVARTLWRNLAYRHVVAGACLYTLGAYGSGVWIPSYFIRHHGFTIAETGLWMALLYGGGGLCGALAGGWLAEHLGNRSGNKAWYARICGGSLLATLPLASCVFLIDDPHLALGIHGLVVVLMHMNIGPVLTLIQHEAGPRHRATGQAVSVLVSNLAALPLGPLFVGVISDRYGALYGTQVLGWAILSLLLCAWSGAAWHFSRAARSMRGLNPDA